MVIPPAMAITKAELDLALDACRSAIEERDFDEARVQHAVAEVILSGLVEGKTLSQTDVRWGDARQLLHNLLETIDTLERKLTSAGQVRRYDMNIGRTT